jgi:glucose/arabinose dehydrogenase
MHPLRVLLLVGALGLSACTAIASNDAGTHPSTSIDPSPATTDIVPTGDLVDIGSGIHGPTGLVASIHASGLPNVAAFAFDDAGRLWAATAAYADDGTDAIYRIDRAGAAPVRVVYGLHTVLGLVWSGDILFVASAGRVDAYTGLAGDRFETNDVVVTLPTGVGEVNGLTVLPDGRLALGVSAPCDACTPTIDEAAAVLTFLPDGSEIRAIASGIRAPVGLTVLDATGDLLVTMNQQDQLGDATPGDWLAVVEDGQDWGFPDCVGQTGDACANVPEPLAELDRHAAVSGVAVVDGSLGETVGTAALVAEWTTGKVVRVGLDTTTTPVTSTGASTLLTGIGQPVAVATAPDGSLVVGDWASGTIYRIAAAT